MICFEASFRLEKPRFASFVDFEFDNNKETLTINSELVDEIEIRMELPKARGIVIKKPK